MAAVDRLVEIRCRPVLSPFRPSPNTPLARQPVPSVETLRYLWTETYDRCAAHGLRPGPSCIPCQHNTLTLSDGSGFYQA